MKRDNETAVKQRREREEKRQAAIRDKRPDYLRNMARRLKTSHPTLAAQLVREADRLKPREDVKPAPAPSPRVAPAPKETAPRSKRNR